jgi:4-hydroxy-tetrahydrodipicolinate reductase
LYSPNFSIGVNMVFRLAAAAAEMMNKAPAYDPYIHEWHHRQKADSPSGTALRLAEILLSKVERKKTIKKENVDGKIDPAALHVSSTARWGLSRGHISWASNPRRTLSKSSTLQKHDVGLLWARSGPRSG